MRQHLKIYLMITLLSYSLLNISCGKEFLDKKPNSAIKLLSSTSDLQALLDNYQINNTTSALSQISSDEYFLVSDAVYNSLQYQTHKNAYIWAADLYGGDLNVTSWNNLYSGVFFANNVIDALNAKQFANADIEVKENIKGSALFIRAYNFHDLVKNFAPVYDMATANTALGIPLKLTSGVDDIVQRSSVESSYKQILQDLSQARSLLKNKTPLFNKNRASIAAVMGLFARVYLDMGNYTAAEKYADSCLAISDVLLDYNEVSQTSTTPFTDTNDEIIYYSNQVNNYISGYTVTYQNYFGMDPELIKLYEANDLRFPIFYQKNNLGNYSIKRGYVRGLYAFTGIAVDEIYLIKAECAARNGGTNTALTVLNKLLLKRYVRNTFITLTAASAADALEKVLLERRKELVWRGLRWQDLKRLNREGYNITLSRSINGKAYTLAPNDPRYVFPIPDDEISLSHIKQNFR